MLKTLGRSIIHFFMRPAPTSAALMVGPSAGAVEPVLDVPSRVPASPPADEVADEIMAEPEPEAPTAAAADAHDELSTEEDAAHEAIGEALDEAVSEAAAVEDSQPDEALRAGDPAAEAKLPCEYAFIEIDETAPSDPSSADVVEHAAVEIAEELAPAALALSAPEEQDRLPEDLASEDLATGTDDLDPPDSTAPVELAASIMPELAVAESSREEEFSTPAEPLEAISAVPLATEADEAAGEAPPTIEEQITEDRIADAAPEEVTAQKPRKKRAAGKRKTASKPRKPKAAELPAEPVPEDDVWVSDAVAWSLSGEWSADDEWSPPESPECPRRLEELREAAAEGRLTIWGRSDDAGTWQPIAPSYWKSGTVEPESLTQGRENVVAEPKTQAKTKSKKAARKYSALKVSKSQVEELWSPEAMH